MKLFVALLLATVSSALRKIDPICRLPKETGTCEDHSTRYFYNSETGECESFIFSGCNGNENNFKTLEECEKKCSKGHRVYPLPYPHPRPHPRPEPHPKDVCKLRKDPGPCKAAFPRWFYNPYTKKCEKFTYGGCGGNGNNFLTKKECLKKCSKGHRPHPVPCGYTGDKCLNPAHKHGHGEFSVALYVPPCCKGFVCCACPPPVITAHWVPSKFGTCQRKCFCPKG